MVKTKKPDTMPIRVKLEMLTRLQAHSKETGATLGWIVNKAIQEFFDRIDKKK